MKKMFLAFTIIWMWLLSSCTNETLLDDTFDQGLVPANTLRVFVGMDGMTSQGAFTRVDVNAEQHEDEIESLFLLFFESETNNGGRFVDYLEIENPKGVNNPNDINMTGTQLKVTDPYHILAIANIHGDFGKHYLNGMEVSAWMLQWVGKTESQVISEARAWTRSGMTVEPGQLLMSGRVEKPANELEVILPLVRNQVRFDVINNLKEEYQIISAEIRNAYTGSKVWNDGTSNGVLDFSDNTSRIPRYYEFFNADGGDITGGLYAFENQVTMPARNDKYTTCLIVKLKKLDDNTTSFYRINIAPDASPQMLKRNNAYRVTIDNVGGEGGDTANDAYNNPDDNQLDFTINAWDITEVGILVQDGVSLLSAPYKTVTLPRAEITTNGNVITESSVSTSFKIYTFTNNPDSVSGLKVLSQTYSLNNSEDEYYPNVTAALNGNVLTVSAQPIPSGATVRGEIRLGYAGLRATINVVQTDLVKDFLQVHLPDGGIPTFAPFGGIQSGLLRVEASGAWSAKLMMPDGGFTFTDGAGKTSINSVTDAGLLTDGNKFRVWTLSPNTLETIREAFVLVTLDKDANNIGQVVHITQDVKADIAIVPQHTVTFDGTGALALIPNNTDQQFTVRPSQTGQPAHFEDWEWVIEGADADKFDVDDEESTTDTGNPGDNFVHVVAKGKNTSGRSYNARLTVRLTARTSVATSIDLVQISSGIDFVPNNVPSVTKTGGESEPIAIQADSLLQWELLSFNVTDGSAKKNLFNHTVKLLDQNGEEIAVGDRFSVAYDKFKVYFPKIYYPNRDIPVSATVEVGIVGSTLKKSITINQQPLTATAFSIAAPQTEGYGNLHGGSYNIYFRQGIRRIGNVTATINASSNMLYRNYFGLYSGYNWRAEKNFRSSKDALTMIVSDEYAAAYLNVLNNPDSPLNSAGFEIAHSNGYQNASINTTLGSTKLYQLLVSGAAAPDVPAIATGIDFYEDGVSTQVTAYPSTTVPIIVTRGTGRAFLAIDPKLRLIYLGESQMFDTAAGNPFLNNLLVYIKNAAIYGSHFTELLIDEGGQPAPWDDVWGDNAGVE